MRRHDRVEARKKRPAKWNAASGDQDERRGQPEGNKDGNNEGRRRLHRNSPKQSTAYIHRSPNKDLRRAQDPSRLQQKTTTAYNSSVRSISKPPKDKSTSEAGETRLALRLMAVRCLPRHLGPVLAFRVTQVHAPPQTVVLLLVVRLTAITIAAAAAARPRLFGSAPHRLAGSKACGCFFLYQEREQVYLV